MGLLDLAGLSGVTLILSRGTIFRAVRRWVPALRCPQCVGFHVGFFASLSTALLSGQVVAATGMLGTPSYMSQFAVVVIKAFIVGGGVSLVSSLADGLLERFFGPSLDDKEQGAGSAFGEG